MEIGLDKTGTIVRGSYLLNTITGIASAEQSRESLKVYPNPATNQITFSVAGAKVEQANLIVTDALGKIVLEKNLSLQVSKQSNTTINISELNEGIYFYRLVGENLNKSGKFIKN